MGICLLRLRQKLGSGVGIVEARLISVRVGCFNYWNKHHTLHKAWSGIVYISTDKAYTVIVTSENAALFSLQVLRSLETLVICDPLPELASFVCTTPVND